MEDKKKQENRAEFEKVFRALGDKHRLQILDLLLEKERNAGELLEQVDVVQSTLSHHMKSLCDSGLVLPRKEGKWTYYAVNSQMVAQAREFLAGYLGQEVEAAAEQGTVAKTEKAEKAEAEPAGVAAQNKKEAEKANSGKLESDKGKQTKPRTAKSGGKKPVKQESDKGSAVTSKMEDIEAEKIETTETKATESPDSYTVGGPDTEEASPYPAEDIDFGDVGVKKTAEPDGKPEIPVVETVYAKMQSQKKKKSKKAKDKKGKDKKGTKKKDAKK